MAQLSDLPCDGEGVCMVCKAKPSESETLTCKTCVTPWHAARLSTPLETLAAVVQWECPDCTSLGGKTSGGAGGRAGGGGAGYRDRSLTDREKAWRRQELLAGETDRGREAASW